MVMVKSWRKLIPEMADRTEEVAARFVVRLTDRGIESLRVSLGKLAIQVADGKYDSRDYYFAEHGLRNGAIATMAVRIAPFGHDLFVEWRHYVTPGMTTARSGVASGIAFLLSFIATWIFYFRAYPNDPIGAAIVGYVLGMVVGLIASYIAGYIFRVPKRMAALEGFQAQASTEFQLSVANALEYAMDRAGISKELYGDLRDDDDKNRRVI